MASTSFMSSEAATIAPHRVADARCIGVVAGGEVLGPTAEVFDRVVAWMHSTITSRRRRRRPPESSRSARCAPVPNMPIALRRSGDLGVGLADPSRGLPLAEPPLARGPADSQTPSSRRCGWRRRRRRSGTRRRRCFGPVLGDSRGEPRAARRRTGAASPFWQCAAPGHTASGSVNPSILGRTPAPSEPGRRPPRGQQSRTQAGEARRSEPPGRRVARAGRACKRLVMLARGGVYGFLRRS